MKAVEQKLRQAVWRVKWLAPVARAALFELKHRFGPRPWVPMGHYYSPFPDVDEIRRRDQQVFGPPPRTLPGIDLREADQVELLDHLAPLIASCDLPDTPTGGFRYYYENDAYGYADAVITQAVLRHLRPTRYLEIGSGHSSCLALDVNDRWLDASMDITLVEPFPASLLRRLPAADHRRFELIPDVLQEVDVERFAKLEAGDVLFVDSSHTSKAGSDVNILIFEILPSLASGVYIHFHDVFYPFEYPREWVHGGRGWTEDYLVRAFLEFNASFEIVLFPTFLVHFHRDWFQHHAPRMLANPGGSLWLRKR